MITGMYSGATALNNLAQQQEVISTNLAHLNTAGYRRQVLTFGELTTDSNSNFTSSSGARVRSIDVDFGSGLKKVTGRPLDLAINGDGFFVLEGPEETTYSKNGVFFRDTDGTLINQDGMNVLGNGETVIIPPGVPDEEIVIDADGRIFGGGRELGQISIVEFDDPHELKSDSQVYFTLGDATEVDSDESVVIQGTRELSNATPVTELVNLIVGSRSFESAQRAMRTISEALQQNVRS
ncbi:MAG: flagellar hook basal-body protein [Planctomycetota bacterium]